MTMNLLGKVFAGVDSAISIGFGICTTVEVLSDPCHQAQSPIIAPRG
jgi:hypothetical protein